MKEVELVPQRVQEGSTIEAETATDSLQMWKPDHLPLAIWLSDIREHGCPQCGLNFGALELPPRSNHLGPFICSECGTWILVMADGLVTSPIGFVRKAGFSDYPHRHQRRSPTIAFLRKAWSIDGSDNFWPIDQVTGSDVNRG